MLGELSPRVEPRLTDLTFTWENLLHSFWLLHSVHLSQVLLHVLLPIEHLHTLGTRMLLVWTMISFVTHQQVTRSENTTALLTAVLLSVNYSEMTLKSLLVQ